MSLHKCSYFKGLKFTLVPARRKLQEHSHLTRTHTLHTWHTHTHTYSIVYRLTHRSPETAVIPSAIKKKTGRLTNGTTHTPNTLFHHTPPSQTNTRAHTHTHMRTHARTHALFVPAHSLLVSCYIRWLRFFLSLSHCVAPVTVWQRLAVSAEKAPAPKILPLTNSSDYSLTFSLSPSLPPVFNQHVNKRKVIFFS